MDMPYLYQTEELDVHPMFIYPGLSIECGGYIAGFRMHVSQNRPLQERYNLYVGIWRGGQPVEKIRLDFYNMHADVPETILAYLYPDERVYVMPGDYLSIHSDNASSIDVHPLMFKQALDRSNPSSQFSYWTSPCASLDNYWEWAVGAKMLFDKDDDDWSTLESYYYHDLDQSVDTVYGLAQAGLRPLLVEDRYGKSVWFWGL